MEIGNQMYELSNGLIDKILNNSVLNTDDLKQVYETIRTPIAKYSLAETHFMLGEYDDAKSVLALIPNQFNFSKAE
ncbi:MAG: hypothetical protein LBV69_06160, partial [Bacteroidales bacterium]|nr:hypothetical protein [Bacteroidales bacterium]